MVVEAAVQAMWAHVVALAELKTADVAASAATVTTATTMICTDVVHVRALITERFARASRVEIAVAISAAPTVALKEAA